MEDIKKRQGYDYIVVDDGTEEVPIYNKAHQEVGKITFMPTDINIITRFDETVGSLDSIVKKLEAVNITAEGNGESEDDMTVIKTVENELFEKVNYILGGDFAGAFFGKINPFSPTKDGKFYFENALTALGGFINNRFDRSVKAMNDKVTNYTHGYRTGKHKNGGKKHGGKK